MAVSPDIEDNFARAMLAFLRGQLKPRGNDCPHPGLLSAYREGKLAGEELTEVESHVPKCSDCHEQLEALERCDSSELSSEAAEAGSQEAKLEAERAAAEEAERRARIEAEQAAAMKAERQARVEAERLAALEEARLADAEAAKAATRPIITLAEEHRDADATVLIDVEADEPREEADPTVARTALQGREERRRSSHWLGGIAIAATALLVATAYQYPISLRDFPRRSFTYWVGGPEVEPEFAVPAPPSTDMVALAEEPLQPSPPAVVEPEPAPLAEPVAPAAEVLASLADPVSRPAPAPPSAPAVAVAPERTIEPAPPAAKAPVAKTIAKRDEPAAESAPPAPSIHVDARSFAVRTRMDPEVMWRVDGSTIDRSADGGSTWESRRNPSGSDVLAVSAPSADVCWAASRSGTVMRSTGGELKALAVPTSEDLVQVTAWNAESATVKTASGRRFSTDDGGRTWSKR